MTVSMEMAIVATGHTVPGKQLQDLITLVGAELRRIMEKAVFLPVSGQLQGGL
jgi:hypothetical protein